eukprot:7001142-Karenia_brevis.AAC.1
MHDSPLLSEVAQGLRTPEGSAELVKMMANPKFQEQAKYAFEQMQASGISTNFLKLEYYAASP